MVLGYKPEELAGPRRRSSSSTRRPRRRRRARCGPGSRVSDTLSLRLRLLRARRVRAAGRRPLRRRARRRGAIAEQHGDRSATPPTGAASTSCAPSGRCSSALTRRGIAVTDPRTRVLVAGQPRLRRDARRRGRGLRRPAGRLRARAGLGRAARPRSATRSTSTGSSATTPSTSASTAATFPVAVDMMAARDDGRRAALLADVGRGPHGAPPRGARPPPATPASSPARTPTWTASPASCRTTCSRRCA